MRIDDLASVLDEDCMHAYPLYCDVARSFLDPELVPFACALTAELAGSGRAPLMHEFGICTAPAGRGGITIRDDFLGRSLDQYLASEEEGARYYQQVLERLAATGAAGAYAWCYGDYDPALFDRAPFDTAIRERSFGLVRADGSEKPAAEVVRLLLRAWRAARSPPASPPRSWTSRPTTTTPRPNATFAGFTSAGWPGDGGGRSWVGAGRTPTTPAG